VKKIVDECYDTAKDNLLKNKDKLNLLATELMKKETMDENDVRKLLGFKKPPEQEKS